MTATRVRLAVVGVWTLTGAASLHGLQASGWSYAALGLGVVLGVLDALGCGRE